MSILEEAIEIVRAQTRTYVRYHNLPPNVQSDDLLQEALMRMLRYIGNYDPTKGKLKDFLSRHTLGAIQDFLRWGDGWSRHSGKTFLISLTVPVEDGAEAEKTFDVVDPRANPEEGCISASEVTELLKSAGKHLPSKYWLILLLYYWEEKSMKEVGELLGINESRVSQLHDVALNKLSAVLYKMGIVRMSQLIDR